MYVFVVVVMSVCLCRRCKIEIQTRTWLEYEPDSRQFQQPGQSWQMVKAKWQMENGRGNARNINNLSVNVLKERRRTTRVNLHAAQIFAWQK